MMRVSVDDFHNDYEKWNYSIPQDHVLDSSAAKSTFFFSCKKHEQENVKFQKQKNKLKSRESNKSNEHIYAHDERDRLTACVRAHTIIFMHRMDNER
jgi:hypothetical protein